MRFLSISNSGSQGGLLSYPCRRDASYSTLTSATGRKNVCLKNRHASPEVLSGERKHFFCGPSLHVLRKESGPFDPVVNTLPEQFKFNLLLGHYVCPPFLRVIHISLDTFFHPQCQLVSRVGFFSTVNVIQDNP